MKTGDSVRLQIVLHYDGASFHGWQVQPDQRTVQGELQAALARLSGAERTVTGSGRTDAGVHATGQVASVVLPRRWSPAELHRALNAVLPQDVWVQAVREVDPGFHARYDALRRTYRYRVGTAAESRSPFHRGWCWPLGSELDRELLHRAASLLPGRRSFQAFAKAGQPERGYVCSVERAGWMAWPLGVELEITADRYLHHMVRYLVGTMVDVARGRRPLAEMDDLLQGRGDLQTSPPAPAQGLFLAAVEYPDDVGRTDWTAPSPTPSTRTPIPAP